MRILGSIPHPRFKIEVYTLDRYFYVEIEAGPMKQCYKLHKETTNGLEGVRQWLDEAFLEKVNSIFEEMYRNHKASIERNKDV